MESPLRILYLEDDLQDVELVRAKFEREGFFCDLVQVETETDFVSSLTNGFHLILADSRLPSCDGLSALDIARQKCPDTPFIFISGSTDEEFAIEALERGATDYVLKQSLTRLVPVVRRALKEAEEQKWRRIAEIDLEQYRSHLEELVEQRTAELKSAYELISQSEVKYRIVADNTHDWEFWLNPDGKLLYSSPSCERITGYDSKHFFADPGLFLRIIHPEDRSIFPEHCKRKDGVVCNDELQFRIIRADGAYRWIEHVCQPVFDQDGSFLGRRGTNRDITSRKEAEKLLRESEERFRHFFEQSPISIAVYNSCAELLDLNDAGLKMFGVSTLSDVQGLKLLDSPAISDEQKKSLLEGERVVGEIAYDFDKIKKSGYYETTRSGIRHFVCSIAPLIRENLPYAYLSQWWDITERKQEEETMLRLERELRRSNHDFQQFAYVAAHDLQGPLHIVDGYARLISARCKDSLNKEGSELLEGIIGSIKDMRELIKDLLGYSKIGSQDLHMEKVDCAFVLKKAIHRLRAELEETVAAISSDELPSLVVDSSQVISLFQNLIGNAIKYHGNETPVVHVSAQRMENEWCLSVKDNGIGIAAGDTEKIFEMFRRLHGKGKYSGTGIGLAICKRIVERHGGRIWVESEPGKGSIFYFSIPDRN